MTFAYLAALHLYLRGRHGMALAAFGVALLAKETAITFPLALLLVDFVARGDRGSALPHARLRGGPRAAFVRHHLPFWGVLAAFLAAAVFHPRYGHLLDTSLAIRPVLENLAAQVNVVAYALTLFVLPDRLNLVHEWPTAFSLLALLALPAAALVARRDKLAAFGILWFFLQVLPTQSVLPRIEPLSERNLYLASMGLFLAAASLACRRIERWEGPKRLLATAVPAAVVAALVAVTLSRNALYADPVAFWTQTVARAPGSASAHVNLGHAHYLAGDLDKSIAEFRRALALERDNPVAQSNLAAAWRMRR
jgi:tetratricopeptide (TPR) repeat protein